MIICGLKLTHDGAVALIKNNKLLFSVEMEKIDNNPRYAEIIETEIIENIFKDQGYSLSDVDIFAIDGWGGYNQDALAIQPRLTIKKSCNLLDVCNNNKPYKLNLSAYREKTTKDDILEEKKFNGLRINKKEYNYSSFLHVAGHITSSYSTSPFALRGESSYVLIWDGGMYPRLYFFDVIKRTVHNLGPIFLLVGNFYTIFAQHFSPFKVKGNFAKDDLSIAGKVMAYIANGKVKKEMYDIFNDIYLNYYNNPMGFANFFANIFKQKINRKNYKDRDILATVHEYLAEMLIKKIAKKISRLNFNNNNLCFAGGCALNIKWNSAIRDSDILKNVYVPPFPNDSGSAIGAATCALYKYTKYNYLDWNVYSGLSIKNNGKIEDWKKSKCSFSRLAKIIFNTNEPIVFLNGRAELGPRALGNRSILASAVSPRMKEILNNIKKREQYRPISPICKEDKAKNFFNPGSKDPFMLFDHKVRSKWRYKIPAIIHSDQTARLQTVNAKENPNVYKLLDEYEKLSGIPLLCNTSANFNGSGFFPDVKSAMQWNQVNYVWCENILFEKKDKIIFDI